MKILVLIKQVPDTEAQISVSGTDISEDGVKWIISPYDEIALEEAIRIKEKQGDVSVTVLSVGPDRVVSSLRTAYAMGADHAIWIKTEKYNMLDSLLISEVILKAIEGTNYDLILAGRQATDSDNGQVPILLAAKLDCAIATFANEVKLDGDKVQLVCEVEGGEAVFEASFPVVVTANDRLNEPRYPSLKGIMSSKKKPIDTKNASELGCSLEPKVTVKACVPPAERPAGKLIEGETAEEKVKALVDALHNDLKLI